MFSPNILLYAPSFCFANPLVGSYFMPSITFSKMIKSGQKGTLINKMAPEIFAKYRKLTQDILLFDSQDIPELGAFGLNCGPVAYIECNKELREKDPLVASLYLKHEISHILHNDMLLISGTAIAVSLVAAVAMHCLIPFFPSYCLPMSYCFPYLSGAGTMVFLRKFVEARADAFSYKHASILELQRGERHARMKLEVNKEMHKQYPQYFSKDGNTSLGHTHPAARIIAISAELRRRKASPLQPNESKEQVEREQSLRQIYKKCLAKSKKVKMD